jgi:peptidyl-prolyl cis-trans isomerase B (cyclophilin B)
MSAVKFSTNHGEITIKLFSEESPKTVANFLSYLESGHYNGTIFHRVIPGFMIQGGGFETGMVQKDTPSTVENEAKNGLSNKKYTLAMARTAAPHSATCQFFINGSDNNFLDAASSADGWGYCVFAEVTSGQDVVDSISKVSTGFMGGHQDVPHEEVIIKKAEVVESV